MPGSTDTSNNPATMFDTWMKSVSDFWSNTTPQFPLAGKANEPPAQETGENPFLKTGMETWQAVLSAMEQFAPQTPSGDGFGSFPETFSKMTQPVFSNVTQMFKQWQDRSLKSADYFKAIEFDTIDKDILTIWENVYDTEFRRFFKAPQLGLTREHQEKIANFADRFNILQTTMAEFLNILTEPLKNSQAGFQKKLAELAQKNELPTDTNGYYRLWLKILEGQYMTLFQSPEYMVSLGKTLSASSAYTRAKKELINDLLAQLSIPSSEQMDAVYRELHDLKKRLKKIEKALSDR